MSNNSSNTKRSYRFAIRSSLFITIVFGLLLLLFHLIFDLEFKKWWHELIMVLLLFSSSFFIIQYRVQRFIYRRIKKIYEDVSLLETSSFTDREIATDMRTLTEQVERFAKDKKIEIETLKVRETYRKEFLGNISHELKTPLFTVQGI